MKKLILVIYLLFFVNVVHSQIKTDKVAHFGVGYITGSITTGIFLTNSNGNNEWIKSISVGLGSGLIIGSVKEFYDYKSYGKFDFKDLGYTVLGSTLGSVTIKISINRYVKKNNI